MKNSLLPNLFKLGALAALAATIYFLRPGRNSHRQDESESNTETRVAVQVGKVSLQTLRHYVTAFGTVEPAPATPGKAAASAKIGAPLTGVVADVHCVEGQHVDVGQPLFTLDSRKLDTSIEQARHVLAAAQHNFDEQERASKQPSAPLWLLAGARQERDHAQSSLDYALAQRPLLKVTAPLSGTVVFLNIRPGEVIDPESPAPLAEVIDLERLIVAANIPSSQLPAIMQGQEVELVPQQNSPANFLDASQNGAPDAPPPPLTGQVAFVEDRIDPKTDMGFADISLPAKTGLRPGQFVRVHIITEERRDCLTVPSRSLVRNEAGEWVVSLVSGKRAIQSPVTVGFREGDLAQIQSLILQPGDKVVTTGAYGLPEKTKIRILND